MGFAGVWHNKDGNENIQNDQWHQTEEDHVPAKSVDDEAGDGWPDGWCDRKDQTNHAHGFTTLVWWVNHENRSGKQRHQHTKAHGLQHAGDDQEREAMRQTAEQGADGEKRHCRKIELAGFEPRHEISGARDHDPVDQEEDGGQPLTSRCINVQVGHDAWQGRAEDCLVNRPQKATEHHQVDGGAGTF